MFNRLRRKIIVITMTITTVVLILAGAFIMLFSSTMRPEPEPPKNEVVINVGDSFYIDDYIKTDREEGNARLLVTLLWVGASVEVVVFLIIYYLSQKIVAPVQDSYDKQKLFIANASHELKTPLAVIQANMEALEVEKDNEKWKANIENEIEHANKLVLDLLQLARMDAGNIEKSTPEEIDLNKEVQGHVEMFRPKFSGKINFKQSDGRETYILPKRDILQVLDILLDNATKYGEKKISVVLSKNSIAVSNDGATVPKAEAQKIFDRFYQTDKTKAGSGLGLAIAKALCEQNGWEISCESTGRSTKFIVVFAY